MQRINDNYSKLDKRYYRYTNPFWRNMIILFFVVPIMMFLLSGFDVEGLVYGFIIMAIILGITGPLIYFLYIRGTKVEITEKGINLGHKYHEAKKGDASYYPKYHDKEKMILWKDIKSIGIGVNYSVLSSHPNLEGTIYTAKDVYYVNLKWNLGYFLFNIKKYNKDYLIK